MNTAEARVDEETLQVLQRLQKRRIEFFRLLQDCPTCEELVHLSCSPEDIERIRQHILEAHSDRVVIPD